MQYINWEDLLPILKSEKGSTFNLLNRGETLRNTGIIMSVLRQAILQVLLRSKLFFNQKLGVKADFKYKITRNKIGLEENPLQERKANYDLIT